MISVIVPIYNTEEYLHDCIKSILNQTYQDLQIILIDDGSTDKSGEIADSFARQDKRCIVIHQPNKGLSEARNTGMIHASGEYITFVDGDDYIHPQMLEILYNVLCNSSADFSMALHKKVYAYAAPLPLSVNADAIFALNQNELLRRFWNIGFTGHSEISVLDCHVVWGKLFRRTRISELRFKSVKAEDVEICSRIYLQVKSVAVVNRKLYYYVQRNSSIIHSLSGTSYINIMKTYHVCLDEIPKQYTFNRSLCLQRLYWKIIDTIQRLKKTEQENLAKETAKAILHKTFFEYLLHRDIACATKIQTTISLLKSLVL